MLKNGFQSIFRDFNCSWLPSFSSVEGTLGSDERFHDAVVAVHHFVRSCVVLVAFCFFLASGAAMVGVGTQTMRPTIKHLDEIIGHDVGHIR